MTVTAGLVETLVAQFGDKVKENISLAPYTSARIGGPADILITAGSADELAAIVTALWSAGADYFILGGGSNVLVSDRGVRGVTVLNRAKLVRFAAADRSAKSVRSTSMGPDFATSVWAESGVVFSNLANRCASRGLSALEWAATIPGTIGGAGCIFGWK